MRIFVTGYRGFVGRHLVPRLTELGHEVVGKEKLDPLPTERFDAVFHLAANIPSVDERMKSSVAGYQDLVTDYRMFEYVEATSPAVFVYPSSCAVDSNADPYAWVKRTGERLCLRLDAQGIGTVVLRPFSGYGPGQSDSYPVPAIIRRALKWEDPLVVWGSGKQVRDFIYVDDLVGALIWALTPGFPKGAGIPIDIGTGIGTNFKTLARNIAEIVGYIPIIQGDSSKPESSPRRVADTLVAGGQGFKAKIPLAEGLRRTIERMRNGA